MSYLVEQNKTVRLLKAKSRHSSSGSGSYASGASGGSYIMKRSRSISRLKNVQKKSKERKIKVLDADGEDVTPRPLTRSEPDTKRTLFFLEELKEQFEGSSSASDTDLGRADILFSTTVPVDNATTQGTIGSMSLAPEESLSVFDLQNPQKSPQEEAESMTQVTEEILKELVHICLSETETISLLDIPCTVLSSDAEDAEEHKERNRRYIELCKGKPGNEKFVEREMQTLNDAPKTIGVQTHTVVTADADLMATNWGIYDSLNELADSTAEEDDKKAEHTENIVRTLSNKEKGHSCSSTGSGSTAISSQPDLQYSVDGPQGGAGLQTVMNSQELLQSLQIAERTVVANIYQRKLASYKGLPILPDPWRTEAGVPEQQSEECPVFHEEVSLRPVLNLLWSFSCELTAGCRATSLSWHKKSTDTLAVAYDNSAKNINEPGLICVWSLKNITWPERVIRCHSRVTSLDFSPNVPAHLGVGMTDGTVAIFNVADRCCVASSTQNSNKYLHEVSQVSWSKQALVSISVDGLIKSWFLGSKSLECTDLFQLRTVTIIKKEPLTTKKTQRHTVGGIAPGLCFHFHPVDVGIYLAGTRQGLIHMCSYSNRGYVLETYEKHLSPVNSIAWSPFSPDLFLSCSSDWTVQLWRRDSPSPVLIFIASQAPVLVVRWSPKWPTVFAALKADQLEIWDLKTNILDPTAVLAAPESAKLNTVEFCPDTDAVVLGDSGGEVRVYQLQNLGLSDAQVVKLEDVI